MRIRAAATGAVLVFGLAGGLAAQAVQGRATLTSMYAWRGLTLVNRPVVQPEVSFGAGPVSLGLWANIEPVSYKGDRVLSALDGRSAPGCTEVDPYVEVGRKLAGADVAFGAYGYLFTHAAGHETEPNTAEVYGRASLPGPLPLTLSAFYDVHAVKGAYIEAALEHGAPALPALQLALRVGASFGEDQGPESAYYDRNGITHVETGASLPLSVSGFQLRPSVTVDFGVDPATKLVAPDRSRAAKLFAGISVGWPAGGD